MANGIVAVVGSPNVGKSTIFNRIVGKRHSIVDDAAGITRDRIYAKASWLTKEFSVVDTGGVEIESVPFQKQIRAQVEIAIEEADVIIFVVDGKVGVTRDDRIVAKMLYKANKPIILAVNKIDSIEQMDNISEFYALGLGDPLAVSGAHGIGIGDLLDKVISLLPEKKIKEYDDTICFSLIGRPNVGKSSLVNAILNQNRVIVSNIEGTTRDAIDTPFKREGKNYMAIDTAGLKKRGKIYESVDKYSALRALSAIERSQIVLLVIDAKDGIKEQDKHVVGYAIDAKKAIIIVVNKWDAIEKNEKTMAEFTKTVRDNFKFLDYAPIVFVSALNKSRINTIFDAIDASYEAYNTRVATSVLNEVMQDAQIMNPAPYFNGGRIRIFFANQVSVCPPTFVLFVNDPNYMHFSYNRYIENKLRDTFDFSGTPINIVCRERK
ncbi:MAG: ribosome biogenesis GTPase Der [Erysipelotrichales bacterium]|nr:ribosome biogenesis GTPase Der [Erysipelotrichales bacterium]